MTSGGRWSLELRGQTYTFHKTGGGLGAALWFLSRSRNKDMNRTIRAGSGLKEGESMRKRLPFIILASCVFLMSTVPLSAAREDGERSREISQTIINSTATGLGAVLKDIKAEKDRIQLIQSFIDPIRFYPDKSGYFYVYDFDCVNMAHATQKDLVGKNLRDYQDCKGKFVIRELSEAARKGGGFVEYFWVKPGLEGEHKKIGYVEPIPNTEYFIGTGVYLAK